MLCLYLPIVIIKNYIICDMFKNGPLQNNWQELIIVTYPFLLL